MSSDPYRNAGSAFSHNHGNPRRSSPPRNMTQNNGFHGSRDRRNAGYDDPRDGRYDGGRERHRDRYEDRYEERSRHKRSRDEGGFDGTAEHQSRRDDRSDRSRTRDRRSSTRGSPGVDDRQDPLSRPRARASADRHDRSDREQSRTSEHSDRTDRGHSRSDDRERSRERSRDRERSFRGRDGGGRSPGRERRSDTSSAPLARNAVVMVKGIPLYADRSSVWEAFSRHGASNIKDIRMITEKRTGIKKDYCFVEFDTVKDASAWVEGDMPSPYLDSHRLWLTYSINRPQDDGDWICAHCDERNFRRRTECYACGAPRTAECKTLPPASDTARLDGGAEASPSTTLIVRNLDPNTTEAVIQAAFAPFDPSLRDVRLIRDHDTGVSRGFAFLQYSLQDNATRVLETVRRLATPLSVDGNRVTIEYARSHGGSGGGRGGGVKSVATPHAAVQAAMAMSAAAASQASIYGNPDLISQVQRAETTVASTVGTNVNTYAAQHETAAVAVSSELQLSDGSGAIPAGLAYDQQSGFHYDPKTLYYYDMNSGYYYDGTTGVYMYLDVATHQYVPVDTTANTAATTAASATDTAKEEVKPKISSAEARKIAKDMERWEKKRKKESKKLAGGGVASQGPTPGGTAAAAVATNPVSATPAAQPPAAGPSLVTGANAVQTGTIPAIKLAPTGTGGILQQQSLASVVEISENVAEIFPDTTVDSTTGQDPTAPLGHQLPDDARLLALYSKGGTDAWEVAQGRVHIDEEHIACLLCQRKLDSLEKLEKHVRVSKLHATNLAAATKTIKDALTEAQIELFDEAVRKASYRDRAAERRKKLGLQAKKVPRKKSSRPAPASQPVEQPNRDGIQESNIGNKMLKAMGWSKGQGLGREGQGITAPIKAFKSVAGAGIGAAPVLEADGAADVEGYAANATKMARARFNMLS